MAAEVIDDCLPPPRKRARGDDAHPLPVEQELDFGVRVQPALVPQFLGNRHLSLAGDTHSKNLTSDSYLVVVSHVALSPAPASCYKEPSSRPPAVGEQQPRMTVGNITLDPAGLHAGRRGLCRLVMRKREVVRT